MEAPVERAFLFADLVGYTALTEAHSDRDGARVATCFAALAAAALADGAHVVKALGDGVMIAAPTVAAAVHTAQELLNACRRQVDFPAVRIGIHVGTAVEDQGDYYGAAVNLAARISAVATPGTIACSEPVARAIEALQLGHPRGLGEVRLKNVPRPVALYALSASEVDSLDPQVDPVCRMRLTGPGPYVTRSFGSHILHFCSEKCATLFDGSPDDYTSQHS